MKMILDETNMGCNCTIVSDRPSKRTACAKRKATVGHYVIYWHAVRSFFPFLSSRFAFVIPVSRSCSFFFIHCSSACARRPAFYYVFCQAAVTSRD